MYILLFWCIVAVVFDAETVSYKCILLFLLPNVDSLQGSKVVTFPVTVATQTYHFLSILTRYNDTNCMFTIKPNIKATTCA